MGPRVVDGSCWPCRKRRLKCDLRRPACTKCLLVGGACDYSQKQLQWVGGAAFRGRLKSMGAALEGHALHSTSESPVDDSEELSTLPASPAVPSPFLPQSLVLYFRNAVWPRLQLSEQLISLDEEMLMHEPVLIEAILAVSQAHHHLLYSNKKSCVAGAGVQTQEQARQVALTKFRSRIECGVDSVDEARQLFQVVCMFCILDGMIAPDLQNNASESHLKGGSSILSTWNTIPSQMLLAGGLQTHLLSVFATVDLVRSLLSGDKPFFEPTMWSMFAGVHAWWGKLTCGDSFLKVLKVYSEIAFLGNIVHDHLPEDVGYRLAERCVPDILVSLVGQAARSHGPDFTLSAHWDSFCTLYETSAIIYVYRALQGRSVDDAAVQLVVRQAVSTLLDQPLPGMMTHCLIFPLLVVGSHCLYAQDRKAVSDSLSKSTSYLAFGNLVLMADLLRDIWGRPEIELHWWDMFKSVSQNVFLF
ncbi:hypothetical protein CKM354_000539700 [Cercospora kikuchii]|uniref:Zn(2)-C6 fungal-type domain-containing protein n=1 Tax=Cercospora kikuchii TaxID=84275 RepID=A0A9P3CF89_9PEZI|nr:uncharacterized protein CKM354_000539700 [Cercospora kikuchii]GIZ42117.1 hypothetical protein CKM354_000539700 [Cercospora kikuchii]